MIWLVVVTALFAFVINELIKHYKKVRMIRAIPGPKEMFLFGNTFDLMVSPIEMFKLFRRWASEFDGIYRLVAFNIVIVNIYNPQDIEILLSNTKNNEKGQSYDFIRPWLKDGLVVSKGEKWYSRRKILTPTFHFNILRKFCGIFEESSRRMVEALTKSVKVSADVHVTPVVTEYTLSTTCETAMGTRLEDDDGPSKQYKTAVEGVIDGLVYRASRVYLYSNIMYALSPSSWKQAGHLDVVHKFTKNIIENRKAYLKTRPPDENPENEDADLDVGKKKRTAMLDLLIRAENDGLIDNAGLQEEVDTFMFAGHDTTASALTYALMLLANNPECQERVYAELQGIEHTTGPAHIEELSKMKYLDLCIKEILRLYPSVFSISRKIEKETKLTNYTLPAGVVAFIHIYDLHRREDLYQDATSFNPDRFLPENCVGRHPYAYIPFSAGPRNCIGQKFAIQAMKSALSTLLRKYKLLPVTKPEDIIMTLGIVLRASKPVEVKFVKRI